jgi:hypothetical protein
VYSPVCCEINRWGFPGVRELYSHGPEVSTREDLTDAYADMADQKYPGDPKGRTYAELAAEGQFNAAIKGKKIVSYRAATKIYFDIEH